MNSRERRVCELHWREINRCRSGCGNCCPVTCREFNREKRICNAHEALVDSEAAFRRRGVMCRSLIPSDLFTAGYYCPPIVEFIERFKGIKIEPEEGPEGRVLYRNYNEVSKKTSEILGYLWLLYLRDRHPTMKRK